MFPKKKRKQDRQYLDYVKTLPCCICSSRKEITPSHIKTRGSGGSDLPHNVFPMCISCHITWGQLGNSRFLERFPEFLSRLRMMGWVLQPSGKLFHEDEF